MKKDRLFKEFIEKQKKFNLLIRLMTARDIYRITGKYPNRLIDSTIEDINQQLFDI